MRNNGFVLLGVLLSLPLSSIAAQLVQDAAPVTFAKDIAPIFQEKCQECHRNGSMAPMSLVTYEETRPWAKSIRQRVITRQMPPWHIDKTVGVQQVQERHVADRRADRRHRPLGGCGRAAGRSEGHAARETVASGERMESREGSRPARSRDQVRTLHHGGSSPGRVVEAGFGYSR